jgi:V8-like Glu-specific endopeptidase
MHLASSTATVLAAALSFATLATAQEEPEQSTRHYVGVDSGLVQNQNPSAAAHGLPEVIWSTVVTVPTSAWLRLEYTGVLLSGSRDRGTDGSFLRLTSLRDGGQQTQHLRHVEEWSQTSAYFNGDAVLVEIVAQPGTGDNRLTIDFVTAGPSVPSFPDTICGNTDDRALSTDPRACRNQPTGCTSWMINDCNHCFLTAGHCASGVNVIQFNVPLSTASGAIQHPGPQDQYAVDQTSKQTNGGQGVGNDWAYFGVFANSTTGLTPHQANGGQAYDLLPTPPPVNGQILRVSGYGSTTAPVSPTWYLVQKTHSAPYSVFSGTTVQYVVDTTGGNSGSPVFLDGTNQAISIHTHGGCTTTGGVNSGTGSNHPGLQAALANPLGVCDCPSVTFSYPNGLPNAVAPNGSTILRLQITGPVPVIASSVRFHVDTGSGFQTLVPASLGAGLFDATFPASSCLSPIQFYVTALDASNNSYADPANAPTAVYSTIAADTLTTLRNYNFNTTPAGWTVTNTAVTTGAWARGTPVDTRGPQADFDGSGQCWVTGNTNQEDLDGGPTVLTTETFALSGSNDPVVSYALWFTNDDNDDRLVVEASANGGGNWVLLQDLGPFVGWTKFDVHLRNHFPNLGSITLRFRCSDNPNNSVTEAAIDAFRIVDPQCTQPSWISIGQGCTGSNGVPLLQASAPPALGSSFDLSVQNLGNGVSFLVTGFGLQNLPLQQYGFASNCRLQVTADAIALLVATAGTATWSLQIPNDPSLAGLHLCQQAIEIGGIPAVSNAGFGEIR